MGELQRSPYPLADRDDASCTVPENLTQSIGPWDLNLRPFKHQTAKLTRTHQEMRDSEREPFYDDIARTYIKILKKLYRLWDSNPRP